jgi:hypothetical protein
MTANLTTVLCDHVALNTVQAADSHKHGNETSGSISADSFLPRTATVSFLRKNMVHVVSDPETFYPFCQKTVKYKTTAGEQTCCLFCVSPLHSLFFEKHVNENV